jgi:hypothetical protein
MTTTTYASHAMRMANANGFARPSTLHVCTVPAGQWSPIPAIQTTDRKPGRYRRTPVSTT